MRNLEQAPELFQNFRAHKPCVTDAQGCADFDQTQFQSLRVRVRDLTSTIEAHHRAHESHEAVQEIIAGLAPEDQQKLEPIITHTQQAIVETDKLLPKPLQQHQPEEKA